MRAFLIALTALDLASASFQNYCDTAPQSGWAICDPTQAIDARSADIVSRISLADKIQLLSGGQYPGGVGKRNGGIAAPSVGLGPYVREHRRT